VTSFRARLSHFTARGSAKPQVLQDLLDDLGILEIEHAPADRLMDLSRIAGVAVFRARGTMVGSFEVERILLRR